MQKNFGTEAEKFIVSKFPSDTKIARDLEVKL